MRRSKMPRRQSRRNFRQGAGVHPKNHMAAYGVRAGIRL